MPPIRIALVGLSAHAAVTWAASAHLPYLLSPRGHSHYRIVALCNSSVAAAEAARETFNLPASVKAYGDPNAVAQDPDVDLVVVCTRVDVHVGAAEPSVRAGKAVFIEYPVAESLARALELTRGARVPDSIVAAFGALLPRDALPAGLAYFAERQRGGNPIVIENGHALDWVHAVLGEFAAFDARMQIQRAATRILGEGGAVARVVASDVPDLLSIQGRLGARGGDGDGGVVPGALLTHVFRHGPPFKGQPGFTWSINGEKGEILVTMGERFLFLEDPATIYVHDHATDEVREVPWDWADWQKELPVKARCVGELYERYAEWVEGGKGRVREGREWPTLDAGVLRLREFDAIFRQYEEEEVERRNGCNSHGQD